MFNVKRKLFDDEDPDASRFKQSLSLIHFSCRLSKPYVFAVLLLLSRSLLDLTVQSMCCFDRLTKHIQEQY